MLLALRLSAGAVTIPPTVSPTLSVTVKLSVAAKLPRLAIELPALFNVTDNALPDSVSTLINGALLPVMAPGVTNVSGRLAASNVPIIVIAPAVTACPTPGTVTAPIVASPVPTPTSDGNAPPMPSWTSIPGLLGAYSKSAPVIVPPALIVSASAWNDARPPAPAAILPVPATVIPPASEVCR